MARLAVVVVVVLQLAACRTAPESAAHFESQTCQADAAACLQRILDRHGGVARFRKARFARYLLEDTWNEPWARFMDSHPVSPARFEMDADRAGGRLAIRYPGTPHACGVASDGAVWASSKDLEDTARVLGGAASFLLALPFRLADPNAKITDVKPARWHGLPVMQLDVDFGEDATDDWKVYVHPKDFALVGAAFSYGQTPVWVDVQYDGWSVVEGTLVPSGFTMGLAAVNVPLHTVKVVEVKLAGREPEGLVR